MQQIIVKLNLQFVSGYGSFNNLYFNFSENYNNKENSDDDLGVHPIALELSDNSDHSAESKNSDIVNSSRFEKEKWQKEKT